MRRWSPATARKAGCRDQKTSDLGLCDEVKILSSYVTPVVIRGWMSKGPRRSSVEWVEGWGLRVEGGWLVVVGGTATVAVSCPQAEWPRRMVEASMLSAAGRDQIVPI